MSAKPLTGNCGISIHALREEGDVQKLLQSGKMSHFYPRPPRGGRRLWVFESRTDPKFLSTPSARRATGHILAALMPENHFYPRPPRGGRPNRKNAKIPNRKISIHALREEGDRAFLLSGLFCTRYFYPRPPRGGRPGGMPNPRAVKENFYPRPPRGGRPTGT